MFAKLFDGTLERKDILAEDGSLCHDLRVLRPQLQRAGLELEKWRRHLVHRYVTMEEDRDSVLRPKFDGLHDGFVETMNKISVVLAVAEKTARESRGTKPSSRPRRKRAIEEADDGEGAAYPAKPPAKRTRA